VRGRGHGRGGGAEGEAKADSLLSREPDSLHGLKLLVWKILLL